MTALTADSLLADLKKLPLLTPGQWNRVESAARGQTRPPEVIVRRLVEKGWVTAFQGETLLAGRGDSLLFGPYLLLDAVGEGGMGRVYRARHRRLGRVDAVKVIRADKIASAVVARRFLREIRLTSTLEHPHIVRAIDAGEVGAQLYLATEFVAGDDLGTHVRRRGPLPVADACLAVYQVALALQHVHERGMVHRDVKPSNLMRAASGRGVKLLDLGLSGANQPDEPGSAAGPLTTDGVMLGTPDFMAPEQARDPHGADIRADLYGLGATFFFLLTGRPPYAGTAVDKLIAHGSAPVPPLVLPSGPAPAPLAAIVARLMAKRPDDRYQTPDELIAALLALRPGAPSAETPPPSAGRTDPHPPAVAGDGDGWRTEFEDLVARDSSPRPPKLPPAPRRAVRWRRWGVVGAAGVAGVALVVVLSRPGDVMAPAPVGTNANTAVEPPGDELRVLRGAVNNPTEDRDALRRRVLDFRSRNARTPLAAAAAGLLRRLPSPLDALAFAPDPATQTPVVALAPAGRPVLALAFAPDDARLLVVRRGAEVGEYPLPAGAETGRLRQLSRDDDDGDAAVTPDGRVAAGVKPNGKLAVWADATGRAWDVDPGPGRKVRAVALTPDGSFAVVSDRDPGERLARLDLQSGRVVAHLDCPSEGVRSITVSPDGGACLVLGGSIARSFSLATGKPTGVYERMGDATTTPAGAFGPDGARLYLIGVGVGVGRYSIGSTLPDTAYDLPDDPAPRGGANPWRPRTWARPAAPTCVAVAADDATLAVGTRGGCVHTFSTTSTKPTATYRFPAAVRAVAFSTHGRTLAVALDGGAVCLVATR